MKYMLTAFTSVNVNVLELAEQVVILKALPSQHWTVLKALPS
jgi:hypothetical protein